MNFNGYGYKIILIENPIGIEKEFECSGDDYILDIAEQEGIELPYSCRSGACTTCLGKLRSGSVDQSAQNFIDDDDILQGWVVLCVATPLSDCEIYTNMEDEYHNRMKPGKLLYSTYFNGTNSGGSISFSFIGTPRIKVELENSNVLGVLYNLECTYPSIPSGTVGGSIFPRSSVRHFYSCGLDFGTNHWNFTLSSPSDAAGISVKIYSN